MSHNDPIIEEFRAYRGIVQTMGFGDGLILVHSIGAKSGKEHLFPVGGMPDGDSRLIPASAAGSPKNPAWSHNLLAHPEVEVEMPDAEAPNGITTVRVRAELLEGAEQDAAWARFLEISKMFADFETKAAPRVIACAAATAPLIRSNPDNNSTNSAGDAASPLPQSQGPARSRPRPHHHGSRGSQDSPAPAQQRHQRSRPTNPPAPSTS
jgi:deazaflavin-dependent oxidoreductase (nitroreductase family)